MLGGKNLFSLLIHHVYMIDVMHMRSHILMGFLMANRVLAHEEQLATRYACERCQRRRYHRQEEHESCSNPRHVFPSISRRSVIWRLDEMLLASRNPTAHRSLIAFGGWANLAHAGVMAVLESWNVIERRELAGVVVFAIVGIVLVARS